MSLSSDEAARIYVVVATLTNDRCKRTTGPGHYLSAAMNAFVLAYKRERPDMPYIRPITFDSYLPLPTA